MEEFLCRCVRERERYKTREKKNLSSERNHCKSGENSQGGGQKERRYVVK